MANIQANIKRHDQDIKKHLLIHSQISTMKTQIKKTQKTKSKKDLSLACKMIDSALSKGIIKKNKADRLKSRLALFVNDEKRSIAVETKKVYKKAESKKPKITKVEEKVETKTQKPVVAKLQPSTNANASSEKHQHAPTKKIVINKSNHTTAHTTDKPNSISKKTTISTKQKSIKK